MVALRGFVVGLAWVILAWTATPLGAEQGEVTLEIRRAETTAGEGLKEARISKSDRRIYLHRQPEATNADIADVRVVKDEQGRPALEITFTEEGAQKMKQLSREHLGKPVAIMVNGRVIAAPVLRGEISRRAKITGDFSLAELEQLARQIRPG